MKLTTLSALLLTTVIGCAAPTSPSPEATGDVASALHDDDVFPPRVEAPIGADRDAVCASVSKPGEDETFSYWFQRHPGAIVRQETADTFYCENCVLDGQVLTKPKIVLRNSSAVGVRFEPSSVPQDPGDYPPVPAQFLDLENTDMHGATFLHPTAIVGKNIDLRCATGSVILGEAPDSSSPSMSNVDVSGFAGTVIGFTNLTDLRATGAHAGIDIHGNLAGARFDGAVGSVAMLAPTVTGRLALDKSQSDVTFYRPTTFDGTKVTVGGAQGRLLLTSTSSLLLKGASIEGAAAGMTVGGSLDGLHFADKTAWTVGEHALLPDAMLTKVDFSGAVLTPPAGETWPKDRLVLDDLKLTNGGYGPGVDLTKVSLHRAHLEGVDFGKVLLSKLDGAKAVGADFQDAHLEGASFVGPEDDRPISGVIFTGAGLRGADLSGVSGAATFDRIDAGIGANGKTTSFARAILPGSRFDHAVIQYTSFEGAHLDGVDFAGATADFADFTNASFVGPSKDDPSKVSGNQTLASVTSLRGATFDGADLRGVNLAGVDLSSAGGRVASFIDALLCDATLTTAKMHGARLTHAKIDVDGLVVLPSGAKITCAPGPHDGLDTSSTSEQVTVCPDPSNPVGGGSCTDAQMKQQGDQGCTSPGKKRPGVACASDCDCASARCDASTSKCE